MTCWDSLWQLSCTKFLRKLHSKGSGPQKLHKLSTTEEAGLLNATEVFPCQTCFQFRLGNETIVMERQMEIAIGIPIGRPVSVQTWSSPGFHVVHTRYPFTHKRENYHHITHESERHRYPVLSKNPPSLERKIDEFRWPKIKSIDLYPDLASHIFK